MATAAQELFGFIQARQRQALDQDKFAEARRQFDVNADLSRIQMEQNAERLRLAEEFQAAQIPNMREAMADQQARTKILADDQGFRVSQAKEARRAVEMMGIAQGFLQGTPGGEDLKAITPTERAIEMQRLTDIQREAEIKRIDALQGINTREKSLFKAAAAGAQGPASALAQGQSESSGFAKLQQAMLLSSAPNIVEAKTRGLFNDIVRTAKDKQARGEKLSAMETDILTNAEKGIDLQQFDRQTLFQLTSQAIQGDEGLKKTFSSIPGGVETVAQMSANAIAERAFTESLGTLRATQRPFDPNNPLNIFGGANGLFAPVGGGAVVPGVGGATTPPPAGDAATRQGIPLEEQVVRKPGEPKDLVGPPDPLGEIRPVTENLPDPTNPLNIPSFMVGSIANFLSRGTEQEQIFKQARRNLPGETRTQKILEEVNRLQEELQRRSQGR